MRTATFRIVQHWEKPLDMKSVSLLLRVEDVWLKAEGLVGLTMLGGNFKGFEVRRPTDILP